MFRIGVQISIRKGLIEALKEARQLHCNTMQIFIRNPRGYRRKKFSRKEVKFFKKKLKENDISPFVVHASYILNLGSSDKGLRRRSITIVKEDLVICNDIGADLYVIHFGSNGDKEAGVKLMRESLYKILNNYRAKTLLLLEDTAGEGNKLGASLEEIRATINRNLNLGVCLDSAHLFSYGYNIKDKEGLDGFLNEFQYKIGFRRLKLLHLNDSYFEFGTRKDRHQHIGKGFIGTDGFKLLLNHPRLENLPLILETPRIKLEDDIRNLDKVKYLIKLGGKDAEI